MQKDEFVFCEEHHCGYKTLLSRLVIVFFFFFQTARQYNKPPPPPFTPRFPLTTSHYELNHKRSHHHSTSTMTLASNISILLLLGFTFTTLLTPVTATHKVNDKCTNKKYFNTLGCSKSECQVVRISTSSSSSSSSKSNTHKKGNPTSSYNSLPTITNSFIHSNSPPQLKCVEEPNGNNAYFWRVQETCQDMQCQNGACNPNFPDLDCFA